MSSVTAEALLEELHLMPKAALGELELGIRQQTKSLFVLCSILLLFAALSFSATLFIDDKLMWVVIGGFLLIVWSILALIWVMHLFWLKLQWPKLKDIEEENYYVLLIIGEDQWQSFLARRSQRLEVLPSILALTFLAMGLLLVFGTYFEGPPLLDSPVAHFAMIGIAPAAIAFAAGLVAIWFGKTWDRMMLRSTTGSSCLQLAST